MAAAATLPEMVLGAEFKPASARRLPRWREFNLLEKFSKRREGNPPWEMLELLRRG